MSMLQVLERIFEKKELGTATENVEKLTADNARLEEELAESKKTVDQRYSNEYVADLLGGMEQLQNELSSSQPSQQVKDAEIRELAFENSRLKGGTFNSPRKSWLESLLFLQALPY